MLIGSGDRADRTRADTECPRRLHRALTQFRMRRQTQVVVRREIDDRAMVEGRVGLLFTVEDAQATVQSLCLQRVEFVG